MILVGSLSIAHQLFAGSPQLVALLTEPLLPVVQMQLVGFERTERLAELGIERFALGVPCAERFANRLAIERWRKSHSC